MKSTKYIMLILVAFLALGCSFDDSALQDRLADIQERIAALQADIDDFNDQLEALSYLTSGNVITSVTVDSDGYYVITYRTSDDVEQTVVIATMSQMINVPILGVELDETNNLYYWTVTVDGETSYLLVDGEKVPVAGYTPTISVDSDGYWTVDGVRITDSDGNPIAAEDGESCVFQSVAIDDNGNLVITQGNGTVITIPVQDAINLVLDSDVLVTVINTSLTLTIGYSVSGTNADDAVVAIAEVSNVTAVLDEDEQEVKVSFTSDFTDGYIIMLAYDMADHTVLRPVFFEAESDEDDTERGIKTADDLVALATAVNEEDVNTIAAYMDSDGVINLLNDIDMSAVSSWTPIGQGTFTVSSNHITITGTPFQYTFDGQGYSIENFAMVSDGSTAGEAFGLFGIVGSGGSVTNLVIGSSSSLTVTATASMSTGMIAGLVYDGSVTDITNNAPMTFQGQAGSSQMTMALVGYAFACDSTVTLDNLVNNGEIVAENLDGNSTSGATAYHIAGIAGFTTNDSGSSKYVVVSNCINYGDMTSATCRTSGIDAAANRYTQLVDCVNYGNQLNSCPGTDKGRLGNITCNMGSGTSMSGCINYGDLISTSSARVGGIASLPQSATFTNCANYGVIISDNKYRGLFFGYNNALSTWTDCIAGGKLGSYNEGNYEYDSYTEDEKENYLGQQGSTTSTFTNITYLVDFADDEDDELEEAALSILFIGNSFTKDAVEHLPGILTAAGIDSVRLWHMYYGGRTVAEYASGYSTSTDYHCYQCEPGATEWTDVTGLSLQAAVQSDSWDIVTIQEHTGNYAAWTWDSTAKSNFTTLMESISTDLAYTPQFHYIMSQAYYDLSKIASASQTYMTFSTELEMYSVITTFAKSMMDEVAFDGIIATGTTLQNLRTSKFNTDVDLTRDGYHMDYGVARYAAAATVFESIIGPSCGNVTLDDNTYRYTTSSTTSGSYSTPVTDENQPTCLLAARYAIADPYNVTDMYEEPEDNLVGDIDYEEGNKE